MLEQFKDASPEAYEHLFGENAPPPPTVDDVVASVRRGRESLYRVQIERLEREKETVERALLHAGYLLVWDCPACQIDVEDEKPLTAEWRWPNVPHVPDCIVPALIERYAMRNGQAEQSTEGAQESR